MNETAQPGRDLFRPDGTLRGIHYSRSPKRGGTLYLRIASPGWVASRPVDGVDFRVAYADIVGQMASALGINDQAALARMHGTCDAFLAASGLRLVTPNQLIKDTEQ